MAVVAISIAAVGNAYLPRQPALRYTMVGDGVVAYVLDATTGNVAACKANGAVMICTADDSAIGALMRRMASEP